MSVLTEQQRRQIALLALELGVDAVKTELDRLNSPEALLAELTHVVGAGPIMWPSHLAFFLSRKKEGPRIAAIADGMLASRLIKGRRDFELLLEAALRRRPLRKPTLAEVISDNLMAYTRPTAARRKPANG